MSEFFSRFRFPIAVALTSIALVIALGVVGVLVVPRALAGGPWGGGPWAGGPWAAAHAFGGHGFQLPAELEGLQDLPPAERFQHFLGVHVSLTDRNGGPVTVDVTPGTISAASATSVTVAANDGTTKTFSIDDQTMVRGRGAQAGAQSTLASNQQVIVVTLNNSQTAKAVITW